MNINSNIRKLSNLFIILFIMISGGLVYWQVVAAPQVVANPHNSRPYACGSAPIRGRIFDRNGVLLADLQPVGTPDAAPGQFPKGSPTPPTNVCGYVRHYYYPSLAGLIGFYIGPQYTSTGIEQVYNDYLTGQRGLTGLNNTINQLLHRSPVGDDIYLTIDIRIQEALNTYFDKDVSPPDNTNVFATDRGSVIVTDPHTGEILAMLSRPTYEPNCVVGGCTMSQLQAAFHAKGYDQKIGCQAPCTQAQFENALNQDKANPNCVAINSCNLTYYHELSTDPEQPLLERPIQSRYVPGSTYKTMTLLAGLDSGTIQLDNNQFDQQHALGPVVIGPPNTPGAQACIVIPPKSCGDGSEVFGQNQVGNNLLPYTHNFPVSARYGFVHSDNIIFAQIGANTGANTWLDYNSRFYVGKQIPFDLPVAPSSVTPANGKLSVAQLAENSFGQGVDFISPMQMSLIDDGVANNGQLMRPTLIQKIVDPNGTILQSFNAQSLGNPVSQTTASEVRDAMYGVVRCGSGSIVPPLFNSPWAIMAKTGTGEVGGANAAEAWLITQAPYPNPALTIVAMKENGGEGGTVDGPLVADLYNYIFTNVMHIQAPPPPESQLQYCFNQTHLLQF